MWQGMRDGDFHVIRCSLTPPNKGCKVIPCDQRSRLLNEIWRGGYKKEYLVGETVLCHYELYGTGLYVRRRTPRCRNDCTSVILFEL